MTGNDLRDVTKSYIPLMVFLAAVFIVFQFGSSYRELANAPLEVANRVATLEAQRKQDMVDIQATIRSLASSVDDLRKAITDPANSRIPSDLVRYGDLRVFCLELQVMNPEAKLRCPQPWFRTE